MDSQDSTTLSRDPLAGEDNVSVMAFDASQLFSSQNFSECIDVLERLLHKKPDDPKVLHNIAVAQYYNNGCSDRRKLLEVLDKFKKCLNLMRSGELARTFEEQVHQNSTTNSDNISRMDEFDTSIAVLNTAIILFRIHDYINAALALEPLYQDIAPINETTARHIRLLLLDVALASHNASRAADVIQYLEKDFGFSCSTTQGDNQHQFSTLAAKSSLALNNLTHLDAASENHLLRTQLDEPADNETDILQLDLSTFNSDSHHQDKAPITPLFKDLSSYRPAATVDLKLKWHLYIVQFLLLTRNLKAAKREVKELMNIARDKNSSKALLLKSKFEYLRGNYRKAVKLLLASNNQTESGLITIYNNNLGCIYHRLGKPHTSLLFFTKALKSSTSHRAEKVTSHRAEKVTFSQDKSFLIIYNCGLQYLACGKPIIAAKCFQKASLVFYSQPLLWVRLAECCLLALEKGLLKFSNEEVKVHVVGKGKWRQLVLEDGTSRYKPLDSSSELFSDGQVNLSVLFARQCLGNALHLLDSLEPKFSKSDPEEVKECKGGGSSLISMLQSSVSSYEDSCREANHMIKQSILANLAYIELSLENPLKALLVATRLLNLPECSRINIYLGHVYAAEALCQLNRPEEAAEHLFSYISEGNKVEFPYSEDDVEKWRGVDSEELKTPNSEENQVIGFQKSDEAQGDIYVNLAVIYVLQRDLERAYQFAMEALHIIPSSTQAILTTVYVELLFGKMKEAVERLKQCRHVSFVRSNVKLNGSQ